MFLSRGSVFNNLIREKSDKYEQSIKEIKIGDIVPDIPPLKLFLKQEYVCKSIDCYPDSICYVDTETKNIILKIRVDNHQKIVRIIDCSGDADIEIFSFKCTSMIDFRY